MAEANLKWEIQINGKTISESGSKTRQSFQGQGKNPNTQLETTELKTKLGSQNNVFPIAENLSPEPQSSQGNY